MIRLILILTLLFSALHTVSQDLHFSQFSQSPLNLSPANAGHFEGDFRASGMYRRQWASVTIPYTTFSMAADAPLSLFTPKLSGWGAGLLFNHDEAGDGSLRQMDIRLCLSRHIALDADSVHTLRAGLMGGLSQRSINFNALTFDNQFNGDLFVPSAPSGEFFENSMMNYADAGAGTGYQYRKKQMWLDAGLGMYHLNRPEQTFLGERARRPVLFTGILTAGFTLNERWELLPGMLFMQQRRFRQWSAGAEARMKMEQTAGRRYAVGMGLYNRAGDALIPFMAIYWNKFRFGVSYDVNISSLRQASKDRGGPEFSLVYITRRVTATPQRRTICPVY